MKFFSSIRWRLQLWYGLLLVGVLVGFGVTAYRLESARLMRQVDDSLESLLPVLVAAQHPARDDRTVRVLTVSPRDAALFDRGGPDNVYYVVWLRHGEPVTFSASAPRDIPMPKAGEPTTRQRGDWRETFIFPGPGDCVLVGRSAGAVLAGQRQLAWWLGGVGGGVLVIGLAGGAWLVSRALRPVEAISAAAARIATGDLTQRIRTADSESELGQLAGVLNSTFARLDAAFTQQARFTADAAHELRTPVATILIHTQNGLADGCGNPAHREAFEATQRAAGRMRRLIESLLLLARWDAGQETLRRQDCDLAFVAAESIELVRPLAAARQLSIATEFAAAPCAGDPDRLGQVVANLLANAVTYNRPGGTIRVRTGTRDGGAWVEVADTGIGIAASDLSHVFERFYRADPARSGQSGLGLAIALAVMRAHGGNLTVESQPGQGSVFTMNLPAAG
jgi:two-component system OmpR family sensor kinase